MNAPNQDKTNSVEVSPLVQKLQKLTNKKDDNFNNVEDGIAKLVQSFDSLIGTLANDIKLDIIDTELGQRLGKDMSEEDADKMLIVYSECSAQDLDEWSLAKKRSKVVKLIEEFGKDDCKEYDLATKTRVASLKNKLVKAVKAEVLDKIGEAVDNKVKDNNKDVEQKRQDLAKTEEYKKELQAIEQAKAEKAVRDVMKKRESRRRSAMSAVARAGVSTVVDNCVEQTRQNINAQFDNAVNVARVSKKQLEAKGKDPVNNSEHYKEMEEISLECLSKEEYQLSAIQTGSDARPQNNTTEAARNSVANFPQEVRQTV